MMTSTLVVGPRGCLTLPKELLRVLRLKAGDKLQFSFQANGDVIVSALLRTDCSTSPATQRGLGDWTDE